MANDPFADVDDSSARPPRRPRRGGSPTWLPYVLGLLASLVTTLIVVVIVLDSTTVKGHLSLEIDQAGTTIQVDGSRWNGDTPGGFKPIRIPIREGRHEVHVSKTGYQPETREFELRRGKPEPIVQIRLRPLKKR